MTSRAVRACGRDGVSLPAGGGGSQRGLRRGGGIGPGCGQWRVLVGVLVWGYAVGVISRAAWSEVNPSPGFVEITPELRNAVDRGLKYLAEAQQPDGSYGIQRYGKHAGVTGLVSLAFMADGNLPGRGRYGSNVAKGLDFVLDHVQETGLVVADASHGPMYGHGFATLFLAEIYGQSSGADGRSPDRRLREGLIKATRLIVTTQNHEGGWRYHPRPFDADVSVTICQIMALRAARNAGISVPRGTIDRAVAYVRQCQNPSDGGFRYMLNAGGSAFPRSAAGVASLYYAGVYEDEALVKGLEYLFKQSTRLADQRFGHYFYGHYYAVQAMYLAGGDYWRKWFPQIREELLKTQQPGGNWQSNHGEVYATAMALLILEIPNRMLPIFQR